ncbi:MAG: hypothetical protein WAM58_00490, partial [Candidatus Acidiferrum sp.]
MSSLNSSGTAVSGNASEVFALTDEQIVGIGEDAGGVGGGGERAGDDVEILRNANGAPTRMTNSAEEAVVGGDGKSAQAGVPVPLEAPGWLAERMRDPWHGDEAKELLQGKQKAEAEIAAYREAIGTAEDARALKEIYPGGVA